MKLDGRAPRVLIIAPINTHRQWVASFGEQFPNLKGSKYLRILGTHRSDPEGWAMVTSKQPGVYILSWEAMRGLAPYSVKIVNEQDPRQKKTVTGPIPEGWKKVHPSGASRGYGDLYGQHKKLTVKAIQAAMRVGDVPPWHRSGTWDLVIADESHRMQNRSSSNRRVINQIETTNKLALSGTPAGNKHEGIWATLNWLWPKSYRGFWEWAYEHLIVTTERIERIGRDTEVEKIIGEKYPGAIFVSIPCVVRWRTEQVADQLPKVVERIVQVPMGAKQQKTYEDFEDQAFTWLEDQPVMVDLPIVKRIRLRQAALGQLRGVTVRKKAEEFIPVWAGDCVAGFLEYAEWTEELEIDFTKTGDQPKIDTIKEILSDLPDGEPVLIFTHSAKWARMCAEALNKDFGPAQAWTGALTGPRRQRLKEEFGKQVRIIVAQVASLAEGVDGLQFVCRCEIWASPSEDGLINDQAKARLHRPGQTQTVQRWVLHSEGTIDEEVDFNLRMRRAQMKRMYGDEDK